MTQIPELNREEAEILYTSLSARAEERRRAPTPRRGGRLGWWKIPFAASVATVLVSALVITTLTTDTPAVPTSVAGVLELAATRTSQVELTGPIPPGKFFYQRTVTDFRYPFPVREIGETWLSARGSGRTRERTVSRVVVGHSETSYPTRYQSPSTPSRKVTGYPQKTTPWQIYLLAATQYRSYQQMLHFPTKPAALHTLIAKYRYDFGGSFHPSENEREFYIVTQLLLQPAEPASLRAALYRVLARIPGVAIHGHIVVRGESVTAVGMVYDGRLTELLINPETGRTVGERLFTTHRLGTGHHAIHAGGLIQTSIITETGLVDATNQVP